MRAVERLVRLGRRTGVVRAALAAVALRRQGGVGGEDRARGQARRAVRVRAGTVGAHVRAVGLARRAADAAAGDGDDASLTDENKFPMDVFVFLQGFFSLKEMLWVLLVFALFVRCVMFD